MNKLFLLLIIAMLLVPVALANNSIVDDLLSTERDPDNGLCDANEWFWDKDCSLNQDFSKIIEMNWFIRLLLIIVLLIIYKQRKHIDLVKLLVILFIVFLLLNIEWEEKPKVLNINETNKTALDLNHIKDETIKMANTVNITAMGQGFVPSHPNLSWTIFFIFAFFILALLMGWLDIIADWMYFKVRKR